MRINSTSNIVHISTSLIIPNPYQPRKTFHRKALEDLTYSIKEKGILMPLIVSKTPAGRYELIAGERRYRAARALKMQRVPAIVRRVTSREKLELAIIENVQRQQLNPMDEARSYHILKAEFGLTQDRIAKHTGKARSSIANSLRLLTLPPYVQEALSEGQLTKGHAKLLVSLNDNTHEQRRLFNQLTREGFSVLRTARVTGRTTAGTEKKVLHRAEIHSWQDEIHQYLSTKVSIKHKKDRGVIAIEYYSMEELKNIVDKILGRDR